MKARLALAFLVLAAAVVWAGTQSIGAAPEKQVTLLGALEPWKYPGCTFGGASMSDGGNRTLVSVNCQAILTTDDTVDKVAKFYTDKFVSSPSAPDAAPGDHGPQSVLAQDDSEGRPVQVRVITINRADTSTTLVISRATGETSTHIAWSHYVRLAKD
jgi:hypothetical protein